MFSIDLPTVFAFSALLSGSLGGLLIWLWWRDRGQIALASWGTGRLLAALALPLLASRDLISDWASISLPNAFVCLGYGLTWAGARQFEGLRVRPTLVMAGAVVWLIACNSPSFVNTPQARATLLGLIVAIYSGAAALEFDHGQKRSPLPSRPVAAIMMTGVAVLYGSCGLLGFFFPIVAVGNSLPASLWFGLVVSLGLSLVAGTSILLVALTKEQAEQRSTTALAAARDNAAEASNQKSHFLARMSHELRTPLNGMLGLAQVLANDSKLGEHQRNQAATLEQAGQHLLAILNEVLDLSRIESGRLELIPQPVIVGQFLQDTLAFVQGNAMSKNIDLTLGTAPDLPHVVLADPIRLRQILLNLLNNALKFTQDGGSVALHATASDGETLCFTVSDTGSGVPPALRPRLFQEYAQAVGDNALSGSGLGLAISARLARAMGGRLTHADGKDGVGSCFTLEFPLTVAELQVVVPATQPCVPLRGLRILVVDDVALNRMTARALLQHAGHIVDDAVDGYAALAALAHEPLPDVVLMDQSMPGMDGHTTARRIREMPGPAGRLPILAVTANALQDDIEASADAGMDGHVVKPIELKPLLAAIAGALDRAAMRQQTGKDHVGAGSDRVA